MLLPRETIEICCCGVRLLSLGLGDWGESYEEKPLGEEAVEGGKVGC